MMRVVRVVRWETMVMGAMLGACGASADEPMDSAFGESESGDQSEPSTGAEESAGSSGMVEESGSVETLGESDTDASAGSGDDSSGACVGGQTDPGSVVMIGDSYLAITTVVDELYEHARGAGALGSDADYRRYDQGGTQMSNGQIPSQFQVALGEDSDISTVIMTGGGNDVLLGSARRCLSEPPPDDAECVALLDAVFVAATELLADMAEAGVEDVVYFFYPHLPDGGFVLGAKNETLDYAYPFIEEVCASAPLNCVFVDTRPVFEGHQDDYFILDGVHPNDAGSAAIADVVWSAMVEECVAQ